MHNVLHENVDKYQLRFWKVELALDKYCIDVGFSINISQSFILLDCRVFTNKILSPEHEFKLLD